MATTGPVHWHEGLFLQPHHLQASQRFAFEQGVADRRLLRPYPYGLIEARLSSDALENMLVQFDRLRLITPSGYLLDFPDAADVPALDIKAAFQSTTAPLQVNIGIPRWQAARGNAVESRPSGDGDNGSGGSAQADQWVRRLYRVVETERPDENTGENAQPMLLRRLNARLLLEGEDKTDMEVLPLVRILHSGNNAATFPRQDPMFVPPCMTLSGSNALFEAVRDLANYVEARRTQLLVRLNRDKIVMDSLRGAQFAQLLKLRSLGQYSPILAHMVKAPNVSPFDVYMVLRAFLGELAILRPEKDYARVADYDHDNPATCFAEAISRIRLLLPREGRVTVMQVPFTASDRLLIAELNDQHLKLPSEYFLSIKTRQDSAALTQLVEDGDKFKLMAKSLARANIWGIKLAEVKDPPLQLPKPQGLNYFRLLVAETPSSIRMWERVQQEKSLAVRWPEMESSDYEIVLNMTVQESEI